MLTSGPNESLFDPEALRPSTRFRSERVIVPILVAFTLFISYFLFAPEAPHADPQQMAAAGKMSDVEMYHQVVSDIRSGAHYYEALSKGLSDGHFPRWPVFNWRPPLIMSLLGWIPTWTGYGLLLLTLFTGLRLLYTSLENTFDRRFIFFAIGCVGYGALGWVSPPSVWFTESWSAALLLLSIGLASRGRGVAAAIAGTAAVCARELGGIGALVLGIEAIYQRQWRAAAAWALGGLVTLSYYVWHWQNVLQHVTEVDKTYHPRSWLTVDGVHFLLGTTTMTGFGALLTAWIVLPLSLLGLWGATGPLATRFRWLALAYGTFFFFAGHSFNTYWGFLWAAPIGWGMAWSPACLRDIWNRLRSSHAPATPLDKEV